MGEVLRARNARIARAIATSVPGTMIKSDAPKSAISASPAKPCASPGSRFRKLNQERSKTELRQDRSADDQVAENRGNLLRPGTASPERRGAAHPATSGFAADCDARR